MNIYVNNQNSHFWVIGNLQIILRLLLCQFKVTVCSAIWSGGALKFTSWNLTACFGLN